MGDGQVKLKIISDDECRVNKRWIESRTRITLIQIFFAAGNRTALTTVNSITSPSEKVRLSFVSADFNCFSNLIWPNGFSLLDHDPIL
jgi:hypothetical protein